MEGGWGEVKGEIEGMGGKKRGRGGREKRKGGGRGERQRKEEREGTIAAEDATQTHEE